MRLKQYITEKKWMKRTMIGYKVNHQDIKSISDTVKSFLDRNKIVYEQSMSHHITIAQIIGTYTKDEIVREINTLPSNFMMNPKKLKLLWGKNVKKWFITIEYKSNKEYKEAFNGVESIFPEIVRFPGGMKPHVSLFSIKGDFDLYVWNDIEHRKFKLPKIKLKEIQLFNKKFEVEFVKKR